MISRKKQLAIGVLLSVVVIGGFLIADGLFANSWTVRSSLTGKTQQMSDFGPPTRLRPAEKEDSIVTRDIVAEPVYIDVRIPSIFDQVEVVVVADIDEDLAEAVQIGFELGRDSARFHLQDVTITKIGDVSTLSTRLSIADIPHEENWYRFVLSLPDVSHERPVTLHNFQVSSTRSGSLQSLIRRLLPRSRIAL